MDLPLGQNTACITGVATSAITEQPIMFTSLELTGAVLPWVSFALFSDHSA